MTADRMKMKGVFRKVWQAQQKLRRSPWKFIGVKRAEYLAPKLLSPIRDFSLVPRQPLDFSLNALVCHKDADHALWAIMSFCSFSEGLPRIVIHNDGSLTTSQKEVFRSSLPGLRLVEPDEGTAIVAGKLGSFPFLESMTLNLPHPMMRKLLQPWLLADTDFAISLDCDVLHFGRPNEVLENAKTGQSFFNSDYQEAHFVPTAEISSFLGKPVLAKFNAGYAGMRAADFDLDLVERFMQRFSIDSRISHRAEQSAMACVLMMAKASRLPPTYSIGKFVDKDRSISHHYVNDGSRPKFITDGVRRLHRQGFPDRFSI